MHRTVKIVGLYVALAAASAAAQTNTFPTSGNVGIGTAAPTALLHLWGNGTYSAGLRLQYSGSSNPWAVAQGTDSKLYFGYGTAGSELSRVVIDTIGNVGIGTTNPLSALTLAGSNATNPNTGAQVDYAGENLTFENNVVGKAIGDIKMVQPTGYYVDAGDMVFSTSLGALSEKMRVTAVGNVGIGTTSPGAKLEINGNVKLTQGSGASITFGDGTVQSTAWSGTLCGGDYAESVDVSGERGQYEPGDVLVIDPSHPGNFLKSSRPYSRLVAGIYSTKPGLVGRRQSTDPKLSTTEVPMAMVGIVPTKVTAENGPIEVGDMLVSSSFPAHAMKGGDGALPTGTVIGKALGSLPTGTGIIEVLVSLQ